MGNVILSAADTERLREYLKKSDELHQREPRQVWEQISEDEYNRVADFLLYGKGEKPEHADRFTVHEITDPKTGKPTKAFYDTEWERWNAENVELEKQYHDVVVKALRYALDTGDDNRPLLELLQSLSTQTSGSITENRFDSAYLPMLNGTLTNGLMPLTKRDFKPVELTKTATFTTDNGVKFTIENFDKFQTWGVSTKKMFHAAIAYLTSANYYRGNDGAINPTVEISVIDYGEACKYQLTPRVMATPEEQAEEIRLVEGRIKEFKKSVRRDLSDIASILITGEETRGKKKYDYQAMRIISSHSIRKDTIRINFDVDAARYLVSAYIMQFPRALFAHDNRKPNAYNIGWKIAFHNGLDQNHAAGTECTLSVKSLLEAAPEIPTIEAIKARGQRNWKDKIKKPLEIALDENITVGYLSKWEYRDPKTGQTYTAETAQPLSWAQYYRLMVDFAVIDAPDQTERRAARAAEKAAAAALKEQNRKKRGRPPKKKEGGT